MIIFPITHLNIDWKSFIAIANKNGIDINNTLDKNGIMPNSFPAYMIAINALDKRVMIRPTELIATDRMILRHLFFSFFFIVEHSTVFRVAKNTGLDLTVFDYDDMCDVGIISGNFKEWHASIVQALTAYKNDLMYLRFFNGFYKVFESFGLGKTFSNYEQIKDTDGSFHFKD